MSHDMLPPTVQRVPQQTADEVNRRLRQDAEENLLGAAGAGTAGIDDRLRALDREWDIERTLEANAAVAALLGLGLGALVHPRLRWLSAVVAGFLLQHALHGWCPPLPVFRRLGVRTAREIDEERYALKVLRGDFRGVPDRAEALTRDQAAALLRASAR